MISVVILTKNEEKNILDCIESIQSDWEVIVVDDFSEDRTIEVIKSIKRKNIRVLTRRLDADFSSQRNFGLSHAKSDWILFLDADERITTELKKEISEKVINDKVSGYRIQRKDVMWGKTLKYGETGSISLVRLAQKNKGKWKGEVHEEWILDGRVEGLKGHILHYPHQTVKEFLREINFYSTIRANELYRKRVKVSLLDIVIYPKAKFITNYFFKLGFLDGIQGLLVALIMSFHSFLVRGKLWQLQKK